MIIYPAIDLRGGRCVRLHQGRFDETTVYADDPVEVARRWQAEGARWLHVVDLDGARSGQPDPANREALRRMLAAVDLPVQLGGGIRSLESAAAALELGVARVVVGTAVARDPALAETLFAAFDERIAVGVDARDGIVAVQGWEEQTGEAATAFVARMAEHGAKRFIFTDIARDGTLTGVNLASLAQVAQVVPQVPVIASGGVASLADIAALVRLRQESVPNLEGVIIGKALYAGTVTLPAALACAASEQG
jgi:phosphoribosylformimino-5-aminoimidazole carboxamide ribotide isomerase